MHDDDETKKAANGDHLRDEEKGHPHQPAHPKHSLHNVRDHVTVVVEL